jgi:hypothetical protein
MQQSLNLATQQSRNLATQQLRNLAKEQSRNLAMQQSRNLATQQNNHATFNATITQPCTQQKKYFGQFGHIESCFSRRNE